MKKIFTLLTAGLLITGINTSFAQNDTIVFEDFQDTANALVTGWDAFPSGSLNEMNWTNFDEDNLLAANNRPNDWYLSFAFSLTDSLTPAGGDNFVAISSSWLDGFAPGNRNWIMTPAITVQDTNVRLSWKSCPFQTPLYIDGYQVLVSTTDNNETSFTDVLFETASFLGSVDTTSPPTGNYSLYTFTPPGAFVHGMDSMFIEVQDTAGDPGAIMRNIGVLKPFEMSLSQYNGQTIYIAFLHNSDDDNLIALDDIAVTGTGSAASVNFNESFYQGLTIFPNPSVDVAKLDFEMPKTSNLLIRVRDISGKIVQDISLGKLIKGHHNYNLDVSELASGAYTVTLMSTYGVSTSKLIVE